MENISNKKGAATMALIMGTLAMLVSFMAWSSISPLANIFGTALHISLPAQKMLVATPVLLGSIMRIPMGILADRLGGKKVYIGLMVFNLIPILLTPWVINTAVHAANPSSYYGLMVFVALLMGMAGTSFAVSVSYVSVWFPAQKQGQVLGITGMGNIGNAVAALVLPMFIVPFNKLKFLQLTPAEQHAKVLALNTGVSHVYYFLAGLTVVFLIIFAFTTTEMPTDKTKTLGQALSVAKHRDTWVLSLFYMLTFGSFVAFGNLLPTLLSNPKTFNVALVSAGLLAASFSGVATFVRPMGGALADKIRPATLLMVAFIGILASSVFLVIGTQGKGNMTIFVAAIVVEAVFAGLGNGIVFKMVPYVAKGNTGATTGFVGALGGLGGYFPTLVVAAYTTLMMPFVFLGGFTVICMIVLWYVFFFKKEKLVDVDA